ncbi:MAG: hypothetical protein IJW86_03015 [Clostridia bacterium]|nr:hypothetical protein [Clostridia bacterium]
MNSECNNLKILFRIAKPDKISVTHNRKNRFLRFNEISKQLYIDYARECYPTYSENEIQEYYNQLNYLCSTHETKNYFYLLADYGKKTLELWNGSPVVKFDSIIDWHDISHEISQDLIISAYLANNSLEKRVKQDFFAWPTTLKTSNRQLQNILNNGISENHYHLNGSTQVFPITWVSLMNLPTQIVDVTKKMGVNLTSSLMWGESDNQSSWNELLKEAAAIRYNLFCALNNYNMKIDTKKCYVSFAELQRNIFGISFYAAFKDTKYKYSLDYALTKRIDVNNYHYNRILAGERKFLYDCFFSSFSGKFNDEQNNLFYKYVLIKTNFRAEIIQSNKLSGFKNFANYQDRKGYAIEGIPKYAREAIRTSINEVLDEQPIISLETRIMPRDRNDLLVKNINYYDETYKSFLEELNNITKKESITYPHFYVLHYPKGTENLKQRKHGVSRARNQKQREKYKKCSKTTMYSLSHLNCLRNRVLGIDACSNEIGCRPEVFATEYRYLKEYNMQHRYSQFNLENSTTFYLNRTYHVGEDFLDIIDGLRSIDETIRFLGFSYGDRFGHALALGINPHDYYKFKNYKIILPCQDALDDFVWIYMRSNEMNISIEPILKQKIESIINELANYIYYDFIKRTPNLNISVSPYDLFSAWKLRGDNPECYRNIKFTSNGQIQTRYDRAKYEETPELNDIRNQDSVTALYYAYHYEYSVRAAGEKPYEFEITPEYIALVSQIQKKMQFEVAAKGIMIECNPSSNCLIGTFKTYEKHPITSFFNLHLESNDEIIKNCPQLSVSINTDDQGVFDTSLEYEYALMASALINVKDDSGKNKYSPSQVYEYLDCVRKMGNVQSFKSQQNSNR